MRGVAGRAVQLWAAAWIAGALTGCGGGDDRHAGASGPSMATQESLKPPGTSAPRRKEVAPEIAGVGFDPPLTAEMIERVRKFHRTSRLGLAEITMDQAAANANTYGEFVTQLYSQVARQNGKLLAGEKTPDYGRHMLLLRDLFPWAKFIHLFRDGRDVALSTLGWAGRKNGRGPARFKLWHDYPIAICALWWRWQVTAARVDGFRIGAERLSFCP